MSRLRVLMFGWEFPPHNSGGLGVACHGLTRALTREGIDVTFILPRKIPVTADYMKTLFADGVANISIRNVDVILSPYMNATSYHDELIPGEAPLYGKTLYEEVTRYAHAARDIAREEEFDVIYAHDWLSFPAGLAAKEVSGKPLVAHIHATEFDRCGSTENVDEIIRTIEKKGLHEADHVIAVSQFTKDLVIEHHGVPDEKIDVVHNGIDREDFEEKNEVVTHIDGLKSNGARVILFVGRITLQKGLDYFLDAAATVLKYDRNVYFVVAGSGDLEYQIMQHVAELGISDRVLFTGFIRGEELQAVYRSADVYVMPSVSEPFGITALESMIHETPVIMSRQSGVSEVVTHALKVDFWDTDELANLMLAVVAHASLHKSLIENGRSEVDMLSWRSAAHKCISVLQKVTT